MKDRIKNISLCLAIMLVFFIGIELLSRVLVFTYSKNRLSFLYGTGASMRYDNRIFRFYRMKKRPKTHGSTVIATFGGSTTYGYNYSADASSWPEELGRIRKDVEIRNQGRNSTNSDYAVEQLEVANHDGQVDIVMWANYVNESDILYQISKKQMLALRIDKTLQTYLLSYWLSHKVFQFLRDKIGLKAKLIHAQHHPVEYALDNYRRNFEKTLRYCKENKIIFICVRLPSCPIDKEPRPFIQELESVMIRLTTQYDVPFIDVNAYYRNNGIFCVANHQDLKGHQETARYISEKLKPVLNGAT